MPLIQIKSLLFEEGLEVSSILSGICRDFAEQMGVEIAHVTVVWEFLESWHYAAGGQTAPNQPRESHPILVDLLIPDFNSAETVERMLKSVAASIAKRAGISESNIFINVRQARSGRVFDAGEIVRW
jgi:hypothetical protein